MKEKANIKLKRIEEDELDIPVFHDDQHGTAIIIAATLINALDISRKNIKKSTYRINKHTLNNKEIHT